MKRSYSTVWTAAGEEVCRLATVNSCYGLSIICTVDTRKTQDGMKADGGAM